MMANAVHTSHATHAAHAARAFHATNAPHGTHAAHGAHAAPIADDRSGTDLQTSWPLRALSVVSCWCRTFGVFGNELGDGVYFLGREVEGTGSAAKA